MDHPTAYTYLALGDSYTIGESVLQEESFPYQAVRLLNQDGIPFHPPRIVAKTGWTTDELETGIATARKNDLLLPAYDFVTLLIGVNNQYRGRTTENYRPEFEELLKTAIRFAADKPGQVLVLSIPDWGITPFANGRDQAAISREIDDYNAVNRNIAAKYHVQYLDITPWTREAVSDPALLTSDNLHPSGKEYARWAEKVAAFFKSKIKGD